MLIGCNYLYIDMKKLYVVAVLIIGVMISANVIASENTDGKHNCMRRALDRMPRNITERPSFDEMWNQKLVDLGLTEDSTVGEFRDAMKAKMEFCKENPEECSMRHKRGGRGRW